VPGRGDGQPAPPGGEDHDQREEREGDSAGEDVAEGGDGERAGRRRAQTQIRE
jgi:hypothetical protein